MKANDNFTVGVDFDGTVVKNEFPEVGLEVHDAVQSLEYMRDKGWNIVLHTARCGIYLNAAIKWFRDRDIPLYGINCTPDQQKFLKGHAVAEYGVKPHCHAFIDDSAIGAPVMVRSDMLKPYIDWRVAMNWLKLRFDIFTANKERR